VTSAKRAGGSILVAQAVDAFTHPEWRRHGIFVGLGKVLLDDLGRRGVHITYGIPNKAAMPGHEKLSWVIAHRIPRYVLLLDKTRALQSYRGSKSRALALRVASSVLSRRKKGVTDDGVSAVGAPEAWAVIEGLWMEVMAGYEFALDRNREYLSWRYQADSGRHYAVMRKDVGGRTVAASVCGINSSGIGQVAEMISEEGHGTETRSVLKHTVNHLRENGCHTVEAFVSTKNLERLFKSEGFMQVSKVPLIAHANDAEGANQVGLLIRAERIMLSLGDSDLA